MSIEEEEIIKVYQQNVPVSKIKKEFGISEFALAYILGKKGIPIRAKRRTGTNTCMVWTDGTIRIPKMISTDLKLGDPGQKVKFDIIDKEKRIIQLSIAGEE